MKVGIDTNILVYYLDSDSPFHKECRAKLMQLVKSQRAVLTQQNLVELAVVLTRTGVSSEQISIYVQGFSDSMPVVRPTLMTLKIFLNLLEDTSKKGVVLFDLYLVATLISNEINSIYTYNNKDFKDIKTLKLWKGRS
jgi:predicted nucleic acid-binding protein